MKMAQSINFDAVPPAMKAARRWCVWKFKLRGDKLTKVPCGAGDGIRCNVTSIRAQAPFETAVMAFKTGKFDGVGFVLGKDDKTGKSFFGLDLDKCRDAATGTFDDGVLDTVHSWGTYAEISPSGRGVHAIGYGEKPPGSKCRKGNVEIYDTGRFFTVTGNHLDGTPSDVKDVPPAAIAAVCDAIAAPPASNAAPRATPPEVHRRTQAGIPDSEVMRLVCLDSDRANLFYGDTSAYGGDDSAADLALCNHLAYWTGRDALQMDSVFRQSGLMRPKWDERRGKDTYGNMTISKAIAGTMNVYTPPDYAHGAEVGAAFLESDDEKEAATEAAAEKEAPPPRVKAKVDIEAAPHLIETIPGILQQHADYVNATNPEAQNQFAIASALLVGGAAMARRFKTDRGNPASIIVLLIDKSSRGKKAPVEAIGDALAAANMTTTYQRGLWQSRQAIGSRLLFNAKPMVCHNEVGGLIGQASNGSGKSIKDLFDGINDLWDSPRLFNCPIYSAQGMRRAGMKADADTSVFRPVVNIAMSCTEDDLFREVKSPLISSGTVPRWTVVVGDGGGRRDDFAPMEYPPQVGAWLRDVSGHTEANNGAAVMTSGGEQVQIETPLPMWEKPKTDPEGKEIIIPITEGARKLFTESRDRQREVENDPEFSRIEQVDVLFGKVTEKAMRTALIVAISIAGENYRDAVIDETAAEWALCWEWYHARKFAVRIGAKMADTEFRALTVRVYDFLKRQVDADGFYKAVPEGILINRVRLNAHPGRVRNEVFQAVLTDFEGAIIRIPSTVRGKPVTSWQYVGEAAL